MTVKANLKQVAEETVTIVARGHYQPHNSPVVRLNWKKRATLYVPGEQITLPDPLYDQKQPIVTVAMETTLDGAQRFPNAACVLNFASGKNPGGGFLRGSMAQEESIAYVSTLYHSLNGSPHFDINRKCGTCAYTDHMVFSRDLVFRDPDDHFLLPEPWPLAVITAPAPNKGAMMQRGEDLTQLRAILKRRALQILRIAIQNRQDNLVLGAWGCGVFRNDLEEVIAVFREAICTYGGYFRNVHFAIFDNLFAVSRATDVLREGLDVRFLDEGFGHRAR
jgi:uncharacterized protein (TIGR02452 family)